MQTPVASIETRRGMLYGFGECLFLLQWQFRRFFPESGQSNKSDNLE
jgi:hypothetical protein